jgi:hypothetical protein
MADMEFFITFEQGDSSKTKSRVEIYSRDLFQVSRRRVDPRDAKATVNQG